MDHADKAYLDVEDLQVYHKLCLLHIEICKLSHGWPSRERYELGSQIRRSSNSSPAQLAEKNDDRRWLVTESPAEYNVSQNFFPPGWPPLLVPQSPSSP